MQLQSNPSVVKRPILISIVTILVIVANVFLTISFILAFILLLINNVAVSEKFPELTTLTPIALSEAIVVSLAAIVVMLGYWKMKQWSVYLFGLQIFLAAAFSFFNSPKMQAGILWPLNVLPQVLLLIPGLIYLKRMDASDLRRDHLFMGSLTLIIIGVILGFIGRLVQN